MQAIKYKTSRINRKGIDKFHPSLFRVCNIVLPAHKANVQTPYCELAQPKNDCRHYSDLGARTLLQSYRGLIGKIPLLDSIVGRQPQCTTSGLAQAGHYLVGKHLWNNKLCGSWQVYVSPACAKPQIVVRYGGTKPA